MTYRDCVCGICGASFQAPRYDVKRGRSGKFCSKECRFKGISRILKASPNKPDNKGDKNPNWRGGLTQNKVRYKKLYRERHPEAAAAHDAVKSAVEKKLLVRQPCVDCGSTVRIHGHHEDYSKPLEVIWLCGRCHRIRHGYSC